MKTLIRSAESALAYATDDNVHEHRWNVPTAEVVKTIRRKTGLSQVQFAKVYGFNVNSLKSWECERSRPEQANCLLLGMIDFDHARTLDLIRSVEVVQAVARTQRIPEAVS